MQLSKIWISLLLGCVLFAPSAFGQFEGDNLIVGRSVAKKVTKEVSAHTTPVVLVLEKMKMEKTAHHFSSDNLYINVTEYSSIDKPTMHRIPEYPSHWISKYIDKVKTIPIWSKAIQDKESVQLIISLVEAEAPPWEVDDLVGSVKLKISLEKGQLKQEWSIPNKAIAKQLGEKGYFVLTGDGAEYKISLQLRKDNKKDRKK